MRFERVRFGHRLETALTKSILRLAAMMPVLLAGACTHSMGQPVSSIATAPIEKRLVDRGGKLQSGMASWYGSGRRTANGERFLPNGLTAAHPSLKFGTRLKVVNERNGRSVIVRVNDRGPFVHGRIIDLARGSAKAIGMDGTSYVSIYRVAEAETPSEVE